MKRVFRRARVTAGLGALALTAGLAATAPAASAGTGYQPSAADFANCPKLPSGASSLLWNCLAIVITGGEMKLGGLTQQITKPITIPVAVGLQDWKIQLRTPDGGFRSDPLDVPPEALPLPLPGVTAQVEQAGDIAPGKLLIPDVLPIKIKVNSLLFGNDCYIGSDAEPIALKPGLGDLGLATVNGQFVIKTTISDKTFAVPAAKNCSLLTGVLNNLTKLPSPSGANSATLNTVIRVKNYAFGEDTKSFAKDQGIH
ncbi:hypothetical protein [Actinomadura atramentaria]|uniref:hypothetical protein n=1 Tax=Actinomadura atramentaria TaxID=1990 RepID=UPI000525E5E0|nr:hypothetical protein [Actinomadura atramentaria]